MKILVVSDVHIGRKDSNIDKLYEVIKKNPVNMIILNGDIFDQFAIWKDLGQLYRSKHKKIVKKIKKILKSRETKIIYTIGNHDWLFLFLIPFRFLFKIKIRRQYKYDNYLFEHGDWIKLYIKLRSIFLKSKYKNVSISKLNYKDQWNIIAEEKNKIIFVGHSHDPNIVDEVVDTGDWVKNNSYAIIETKEDGDEIELLKI